MPAADYYEKMPHHHPVDYWHAINTLLPYFSRQPLTVILQDPSETLCVGQPVRSFTAQQSSLRITEHGQTLTQVKACPFEMAQIWADALPAGPTFSAGIFGYFGYELNATLEARVPHKPATLPLPDAYIGAYHWVLKIHHPSQSAALACDPTAASLNPAHSPDALIAAWNQIAPPSPTAYQVGPIHGHLDFNDYQVAFARIQQALRDGEAYQVNFAQRFEASFSGDPFTYFTRLHREHPVPYSAFIRLNAETCLLSLSPELFLNIHHQQVVTRPIKGTRPRGKTPLDDTELRTELQNSAKDRAENVMIVDLLRNDLGKLASPASVEAKKLCEIETYPNVHHLVSEVTATIPASTHPLTVLKHCFPGGSITGAPKISAMQLIHDLEAHPRHIYCGTIGYYGNHGHLNSNIAIRTAAVTADRLYFWAGGGIVLDSEPMAEYEECFHKAKPFFDKI